MTAWTEEDLAKLEKAIATGARVVEYATGKVEYRSLNEMNSIRRSMRRALGLTSGVRRITPKMSKGI